MPDKHEKQHFAIGSRRKISPLAEARVKYAASWRVISINLVILHLRYAPSGGIDLFFYDILSTKRNKMQRIELHNILPKVFADAPITASDVWLTEFVFEKGEHYMVKAESGTGKSSLCSYIYGYRTDYSGQITFDGADIAPLNAERWSQIRRTEIAYLPQEMRLFPELTALENVLLKNQLTNHCSEREILDMFATLGISDKVDTPVQRLSIGQQQRVAIIRTLCQPCDFIVLDEPVSHLDLANNQIVARLIESHAERIGAGIIATSVGNNLCLNRIKELTL